MELMKLSWGLRDPTLRNTVWRVKECVLTIKIQSFLLDKDVAFTPIGSKKGKEKNPTTPGCLIILKKNIKIPICQCFQKTFVLLSWCSWQRQRRGLPGAPFLAAPPRERPLTCGAGDGQKGRRVKVALKSIQLPFRGGASETQRSPVRPAGRKALTERQGQDRRFDGLLFGLGVSSHGTHAPASLKPLLKCHVPTDDFFHQ